MKQKLPLHATKVIALFPSFFRFITEYSFTSAQSKNIKVALVSVISLYILLLIFLQGVVFYYHHLNQEFLVSERTQLQKEVAYWQQVADRYKGYRDVYYRIASLQYSLGDIGSAQKYLKKAIELDPNFPEGKVLGAKFGLGK